MRPAPSPSCPGGIGPILTGAEHRSFWDGQYSLCSPASLVPLTALEVAGYIHVGTALVSASEARQEASCASVMPGRPRELPGDPPRLGAPWHTPCVTSSAWLSTQARLPGACNLKPHLFRESSWGVLSGPVLYRREAVTGSETLSWLTSEVSLVRADVGGPLLLCLEQKCRDEEVATIVCMWPVGP